TDHRHVFSKGVHLIVDRITPNDRVLAFFADDGRLFFAIPMGGKTCLGTTDTRVDTPDATVTDDDREFLLDNINSRLRLPKRLTRSDIISERCGVRPLVVAAGQAPGGDFLQLSRKHVIETQEQRRHASVFGGKLTDCINIGEEICEVAAQLGVELAGPNDAWFGEPEKAAHDDFLNRATAIGLDQLTAPGAVEPLSERLWRRYPDAAMEMLERIAADPSVAAVLIEGTAYTEVELEIIAEREMVVLLEDFLRRRSKLELMVRPDELRLRDGLVRACQILFGSEAQMKIDEYFHGRNASA
ncbi:MAG: glycerol-3-phosphate dehydrogenase, partial [Gammaproteobacteria bacterium]